MILQEALHTDLYQLTMAQAAWQSGRDQLEACFYAHYRTNPFKGAYAIACGAASIVEYVENFTFTDDDIEYLESIPTANGQKLFDSDFLESLRSWKLEVDIDCVPEGTIIFEQEPILRVSGPISHCLVLETALLNLFGFQTLVATKAARICDITSKPVAEFGLRRAQGPNGGLLGSRAAYIGGCASTSNVLAGKLYGIPVSGTHSHAWIMSFESELEAFRAYATSAPNNAILLVDTYNTLRGVENAIIVAQEMRDRGEQLSGIRIDSGDLAWLSSKAREMLDAAGFEDVKIVATNNLDEYTIHSMEREQDAHIDMWGVGTRLAVAYDQPALGMVYKLSAYKKPGEQEYTPVLKVSEQASKATLPGVLASRRYYDEEGVPAGDMIYDALTPPRVDLITDPFDSLRQKDLTGFDSEDLLVPLVIKGKAAGELPSPSEARANTLKNLAALPNYNRRLLNPHIYPVGLESRLLTNRDELLVRLR